MTVVEYLLILIAALLGVSAMAIIVAAKRLIDLINAIKKNAISFRTHH